MRISRELTLLFMLLLAAGQGWSQSQSQSQISANGLIKYDPLFWKNELNLNSTQSNRIREINYRFYEELIETFEKDREDRTVLRTKVSESLKTRSQLIWQTLDPKQRKKLEKIMNEHYSQNQI